MKKSVTDRPVLSDLFGITHISKFVSGHHQINNWSSISANLFLVVIRFLGGRPYQEVCYRSSSD